MRNAIATIWAHRPGRRLRSEKLSRKVFIGLSVGPVFAFYCIGVVVPNLLSIALSFFRWTGLSWEFTWVGMRNYDRMLNDPIVAKALMNNIYFALVNMVLVIAIALLMAAMLTNKSIKRTRFFRTIFYFPNVMSVAVVSILWRFMYDPRVGIVNAVLRALGLDDWTRIWLGDINTVRPALVVPQVWAAVGLYILIYMTTMKSINTSIYEAAEIDGGNKIQQFFFVTVPILLPTIKITMIYFLAGALNAGFAFINIMTAGGPNRESTVLTHYLYERAFVQNDIGYGASIGVFVLVIGFTMYFLINKFIKSEVYET